MRLKTMFITNDEYIAQIAEENSVEIIFIDIETRGKNIRQANMDTVKSKHSINDVSIMKKVLSSSKLLVRINPLYEGTKDEIDEVIWRGADIIMLPMFNSALDVESFVKMVNGRANTMLLVETIEAEKNISRIVNVSGVDGIHIGLNDLHLAYNKKFMYELLAEGCVEKICRIADKSKLPYGFGGIARLYEGALPAKNIIMEHYRLGSSQVILSRSFCDTNCINDYDAIKKIFISGMKEIRDFEKELGNYPEIEFEANRKYVVGKVNEITMQINKYDKSMQTA